MLQRSKKVLQKRNILIPTCIELLTCNRTIILSGRILEISRLLY